MYVMGKVAQTRRYKRTSVRSRKGRRTTRRADNTHRARSRRIAGAKTVSVSRTRTNMKSARPDYGVATLIAKLNKLLGHCKQTESLMNQPLDRNSMRKRKCRHGHNCHRANPDHFQDFAHPDVSTVLAQPFKMCTDKFINLSYSIFRTNGGSFPPEWYITVANHLRESDYTVYTSLYFNILANLCIHHDTFARLYDDKAFWDHLYTGMEEGAAVTGMYDVTSIPKLKQCLVDMKSVDPRFLSNTALLSSKAYGKRTDDDGTDDDDVMNDDDDTDDNDD